MVVGLWAMRILKGCRMRGMFSDMLSMYGIIAVVVGVAVSSYLFSSDKLSVVLHTSCTRVRVLIVNSPVALCDIWFPESVSCKLLSVVSSRHGLPGKREKKVHHFFRLLW